MPIEDQPTRPWWRRPAPLLFATILVAGAAAVVVFDPLGRNSPAAVPATDGVVRVGWDRPVNTFDGGPALGAGVDGLDRAEVDRVWTPANIDAMRSAGFGSLAYRLRTELGSQAWHWNAAGTWSDPARQQGYWTSSAEPGADPGVTYGFHLPRRGNTFDQAENDGYSRLADDDLDTFWKSNPYLDRQLSGADHPQWIVAAFPAAVPVDTVRVEWGVPFATRFRVQHWTGTDALAPTGDAAAGWADFPRGAQTGRAGSQVVRVADRPVPVRFVRILLTDASGTAPAGSTDARDRLGFAVRELSVLNGTADHVRHAPGRDQTVMVTSSTDPWHRAADIDNDDAQPSLERVVASGLAAGAPILMPVPALYGTPEDAAAFVRYLRAARFPVRRVEVGRIPAGSAVQPEDYGALYLQMTAAMKAADPTLEFGGPGLQTALPDWFAWPDAAGTTSWTGRFVAYLRGHSRMDDFDFFSFEWHPFRDICEDPASTLARHPAMLADLFGRQAAAGLPPDVPKVVTGYGYSPSIGQPQVELPGAIVNAETAAQLLALGGETSYLSGLEPDDVRQDAVGRRCNSWGNQMLFQFADDGPVRPLASLHVAQLLTRHWAQPGTGRHTVQPAACDLRADGDGGGGGGDPMVTAYALRRPDGRLAVLLLNKDPRRPVTVRLARTTGGDERPVTGRLDLFQYSPLQWGWLAHPQGQSYADRDLPPYQSTVDDGRAVILPPYSVSVVRTAKPLP